MGPSARGNEENIGFSFENRPWQTRWATSAPSIASATPATVAAGPARILPCS